jgi:hypothetical protein
MKTLVTTTKDRYDEVKKAFQASVTVFNRSLEDAHLLISVGCSLQVALY